MVIVGSITGNTNTMAGNVPPKADLGDLSGLANGDIMIDGKEFDGAKAYKDSKVNGAAGRVGGLRDRGSRREEPTTAAMCQARPRAQNVEPLGGPPLALHAAKSCHADS